MKTLAFQHRNDTRFAVGDFSPVLSVFSYHELGSTVSPFLLLDHIGPGRLLPTARPGGVNAHPHRGFETVTLVFAGELAHRDSHGGGGLVGPGEVQWMTAASGIVHEERFSPAFSARGGPFEMIQLWINLPASHKMIPAAYQHLTVAQVPVVPLPGGGQVRVVAGRFAQATGPAHTHTRMQLLDATLPAGQSLSVTTEPDDTALVYLRTGQLVVSGETLDAQGLAVLSSREAGFTVTAREASQLLVLTGQPLDEPINGHGPFVMNTYDEILQAYEDVKAGRLGQPTA